MKRLITILFCYILPSSNIFGQSTPEELGQISFACFQKHQLDSFFKLKPTLAELSDLAQALEIDTASDQYKQFLGRYPLVIKNFKDKCYQLLEDSVQLDFSWSLAKIDTIEKSIKILPVDNRESNGKTITITIVDVYFNSNNKRFKFSLGDAASYKGIWKPGNNIAITRL